jgi:cytochrome c
MVRRYFIHGVAVILLAVAALVLIRLHRANGASTDTAPDAHRLAEAWCKECHAIDTRTAGAAGVAPDFVAIANQPSTTELSLKVFLRSSHRNMPNLILSPEQADILASYILDLKRK